MYVIFNIDIKKAVVALFTEYPNVGVIRGVSVCKIIGFSKKESGKSTLIFLFFEIKCRGVVIPVSPKK